MKFKYVIVVDAPVPNASVLHDVAKLNDELHHGWEPVREMPMSGAGASGISAVLILLQKDEQAPNSHANHAARAEPLLR